MDTEKVKIFCRALPEVKELNVGKPSNILSYSIHEKKFAYFKTSDPEKWRFSIRVTPERFLELTDQPNIKPARYMHRFRWVSIVDVHAVDEEYLKELITWSYNKAISTLPKKLQHFIIIKNGIWD